MVLDTHEYLSSQGWSGHGNGLRHGAISRPIIIAQKKNNKGLGKERDDGFQFWNHVFDAAVKTINIKIAGSDDESDDKSSSDTPAMPTLNRTSTGILSNRAPILGGSAISSETSSGTSTPTTSIAPLSIFAQAKRETARRNLYGRFYRAFVIKSEDDSSASESQSRQSTSQPSTSAPSPAPLAATSAHTPLAIATSESRSKDKKERKEQKKEKKAEASAALDPKEEKRRRKTEKREKKEEKRRREKGKGREDDGSDGAEDEEQSADASDDKKERKLRKRKDRSDSDLTGEAKPDTSGLNNAPTSAEPPKKRRKRDECDEATTADLDDKAARKERKRLKREAKATASASGEEKKRKRKVKEGSS